MHRRAKVWKETSWNERCLIRDKSSHSSHQFTNKTREFFLVAHLLVEILSWKEWNRDAHVLHQQQCSSEPQNITCKCLMSKNWESKKQCEVHLEHFHLFEICVFERRNKFETPYIFNGEPTHPNSLHYWVLFYTK